MSHRFRRGWRLLGGVACMAGLFLVLPARAQETPPAESKVQIKTGVAGWIMSQGYTTWNHDFSRLTYKDVGTSIIEFSAQATFAKRWYVRANYGYGTIGGGRLIDDDYENPNAPVTSRTYSDIKGNNTWYVNGDVGTTLVYFPNNRGSFGVFTGFQYWRQQYEATGVTQVICTDLTFCNQAGTVSNQGVTAITNTTTWTSWKLGVESEYRFTKRFSIEGRAAFIPYTHLNNDDIHHLRQTAGGGLPALQQDPSFRMTGNGIGANLEATANYMILPRLFASVGYRFWWNRVENGTFTVYPVGQSSASTNLNEFQTYRHGMTLGLNYIF